MAGSTLDISFERYNTSIFSGAKDFMETGQQIVLLCFAIASNQILWLVRVLA
jgi:hypothetical protein